MLRSRRLISSENNGEPSSARWLHWSRIKAISFLYLKNLLVKNKNNLAFHPGPVSLPGGDGSPLVGAESADFRVWQLLFNMNRVVRFGTLCVFKEKIPSWRSKKIPFRGQSRQKHENELAYLCRH